MAFSMFLFLSLALAKRYAELQRLAQTSQPNAPGWSDELSEAPVVFALQDRASLLLGLLVLALAVTATLW